MTATKQEQPTLEGTADEEIARLDVFLEEHHELADEPQMRWWIFKRDENGIEKSGAISKKCGRWYVNVPRLKAWIMAGDQ